MTSTMKLDGFGFVELSDMEMLNIDGGFDWWSLAKDTLKGATVGAVGGAVNGAVAGALGSPITAGASIPFCAGAGALIGGAGGAATAATQNVVDQLWP